MSRFDRYLLSQLMVLFGFFSLVLVLVYWVNRAVVLFDQLIANGQGAGVFLEFTALSLPNVIRVVLPVSAFVAAVYVTNRMSQESELVAVQASGYSPGRLARPVAVFGLIVALLVSLLTHVLVPLSAGVLADRTAEIAEDITAGLLTDGEFLHPGEGITFYIRDITDEGELRDIFLSDTSEEARDTVYTARRALLLRTDRGPQLVMFDGMSQTLRAETGRLDVTRFDDFAFDIAALFDLPSSGPRSVDQVPTLELWRAAPALIEETGERRSALIFEGHERVTQALIALVTPLVGFSVLLMGGFSRFGIWRQIVGAVVCLILLEVVDNAMADRVRDDASLWPLAYSAVALGLVMALVFLWYAAHPGWFAGLLGRRRPA